MIFYYLNIKKLIWRKNVKLKNTKITWNNATI